MRFKTKLTLAFLLLSTISALVAIGINEINVRAFLLEEVKSKVVSIAATTATHIDGEMLKQIRKEGDQNLPSYGIIRATLLRARDTNRREDIYVKYLYTIFPDPANPQNFLFGIDPEEEKKDYSPPGSANPGAEGDILYQHLGGPYSNGKMTKDPWGTWMTGYAPVYDAQGFYVGTVGADVSAAFIDKALNQLLLYALIAFAASLLISVILANYLASFVSKSLEVLELATKEIRKGNFSYRVNLQTGDEFQDLARAMNEMNEGLDERERLKTGFAHYVSQHVLDQIVKAKGVTLLQGEKRKITVLFTDIRGFTHLSESMAPEQIVNFLNEYFQIMIGIIVKYNGMLDKLIGDGIMAEFGVPLDDPQQERNAVLCAIEMQEALVALGKKWEKEGLPQIWVGMGIHTGLAVVGSIGSESRMEFTAIGDTVNTASRLEAATRNTNHPIIVSESTFQNISSEFPSIPLGPLILPGKEQPIEAFAILYEQYKTPKDQSEQEENEL